MATRGKKSLTCFLNGRKKDERTLPESAAKRVPIFLLTNLNVDENACYGFSSVTKMRKWLDDKGLYEEYVKGERILRRSRKKLSAGHEAKVRAFQKKTVNKNTREFNKVLRSKNISHSDTRKLTMLTENYDPLYGPLVHSVFLYQHCRFGGSWRYMPGGFTYPDFRWIGFNDRCSSARVFWGGVTLWEHTWYRGRRIVIFGYPHFAASCFVGWPYFFNDVASSAVSWSFYN